MYLMSSLKISENGTENIKYKYFDTDDHKDLNEGDSEDSGFLVSEMKFGTCQDKNDVND
jgi:hypothetical protein